jgi:hypothetical protein
MKYEFERGAKLETEYLLIYRQVAKKKTAESEINEESLRFFSLENEKHYDTKGQSVK